MNSSGRYSRRIPTQRPSGETPLKPSSVRFHSPSWLVSVSQFATRDRLPTVSTAASGNSDKKTKLAPAIISSRSSVGAALESAPDVTRQREQSPRRKANSSLLVEKPKRVSAVPLASTPGPRFDKSQTPKRSDPAAASHRPSGENAALYTRAPRSSVNSR